MTVTGTPVRRPARQGVHVTRPKTPDSHVEILDDRGRVRWSGNPAADPTWKTLGNCVSDDPRDFAKVDRLFSDNAAVAQAAADEICPECPVKDLCYQAGLYGLESFGVWGGHTALSGKLRNEIRHRRGKIIAERAAARAARAAERAAEMAEIAARKASTGTAKVVRNGTRTEVPVRDLELPDSDRSLQKAS